MYSHEIDNYLRTRNWVLNKDEYFYITDIYKNPQISRVSYNCYDNSFVMYTKDGYIWKFYVKK